MLAGLEPMRHTTQTAAELSAAKQEFIRFLLECDVLRFGDFTAKSGRKTPYFLDAGRYGRGEQLRRLGNFYAERLCASLAPGQFNLLFGPAYKGIPLVAATSIALSQAGRDVGFCFNRKEAKTHGEGGSLVGRQPRAGDRIVIVEDVTTAGTSIRETVPILKAAADVQIVGLIVSVDRQEKGPGGAGALVELEQEFGFEAYSLVTIEEIISYLEATPVGGKLLIEGELKQRIVAYREQYGA